MKHSDHRWNKKGKYRKETGDSNSGFCLPVALNWTSCLSLVSFQLVDFVCLLFACSVYSMSENLLWRHSDFFLLLKSSKKLQNMVRQSSVTKHSSLLVVSIVVRACLPCTVEHLPKTCQLARWAHEIIYLTGIALWKNELNGWRMR